MKKIPLILSLIILGCGSNRATGPFRQSRSEPVLVESGEMTLDDEPLGPAKSGVLASRLAASSIPVITGNATSLGTKAFSANGKIHPRGKPTKYYFEYGPSLAYGSLTPAQELGPRLTAHYKETWTTGLNGWKGGFGADLKHLKRGGFVRFSEPSDFDYNHADGIGVVHLAQYFYQGHYYDEPTCYLGGGSADFRDASISISLRGNRWKPNGSELIWWSQVFAPDEYKFDIEREAYSNWGYTGGYLTDRLLSGSWQRASYRLYNNTNLWTYAGSNSVYIKAGLTQYVYCPLNETLSHMDVNAFHMLAFIVPYKPPTGSIDFDDLEITYRNHSLLDASNGGMRLSNFDPALSRLTDGWRTGERYQWPGSSTPKAIVYQFDKPVNINAIYIHQNNRNPTGQIDVMTSNDSISWKTIAAGMLPIASPNGPNFTYLFFCGLNERAKYIKFRPKNGHGNAVFGLGDLEVYGTGADMLPDDDWYHVNQDVTGLQPGRTYHYRLVATQGDGPVVGDDRTFTVPNGKRPDIKNELARNITKDSAKVEFRLNSFGKTGETYVEYGRTIRYGQRTVPLYVGWERTPRTVIIGLDQLPMNSVINYRIVVRTADGLTAYGTARTFRTKAQY